MIKHTQDQVRCVFRLLAETQAQHLPGSALVLAWAPDVAACENQYQIITEIAHEFGLTVPELPKWA